MAKANNAVSTPDRALRRRAGTFTAATQASVDVALRGRFLLAATGGIGGAVVLECSWDGGDNWTACSNPDGSPNEWFTPVLLFPEASDEDDLLFRLRCSRLTSGTITYRLSQ